MFKESCGVLLARTVYVFVLITALLSLALSGTDRLQYQISPNKTKQSFVHYEHLLVFR